MRRNRMVEIVYRRQRLVLLLGAVVVLLLVFISSCQTQPPSDVASESVVQTAIAQTSAAQVAMAMAEAATASAFGTEVAAEVARQVSAATGDLSPAGEADSGLSEQDCENMCDTRVAEEVEEAVNLTATVLKDDIIFQLQTEAQLTKDAEVTRTGAGGPTETAACASGLVDVCATALRSVHVRAGPGTQWPSISGLEKGDTVPVNCGIAAGFEAGWLKVVWSINLDREGWVAAQYMAVEGEPRGCGLDDIPPTPFATAGPSATPTAATPSPTPQPGIELTADPTSIDAGDTSTLDWKVAGDVDAIYLYPIGADYVDFPVSGNEGTRDVRPFVTTRYELRVVKNDGSTALSDIVIEVDRGLDDGTWFLDSYRNVTGTLETAIAGSGVTARFLSERIPDGEVTGFGGCNNYDGRYKAYEDALQIDNLSKRTNLTCSSDIMQQENGFLSAMRRAERMVINSSGLTIFDGDDRIILIFES
jgi:uncharacterized protein YraI